MIAAGRSEMPLAAPTVRLRPVVSRRARTARLRLARQAPRRPAPDWGAVAVGLGTAIVAMGRPAR